ncbi:cadherin domain-containing protein [Dongia sp.]|uniref:cadherin domain-containing protein n=1 Tax=Dongia sp. TaxID=1977262 RepID=UPI0035B4889B
MAVRYISPTGSGLMDGSSPENAGTLSSLSNFIGQAGPGGEVLLIADQGTYRPAGQISITKGGSADAPVTIRGIDSAGNPMDADISGTRPENWSVGQSEGSELFRLLGGANNLHFQDLDIGNVGNGAFRIGADISNLTIEHVDADNVYRFVENNVSGTAASATVSGLTLRDIDITGYSKGAIHLKYDSHDVLVENVTADGNVATSDPYVSGVLIEGTAHDIVLRDVEVSNSKATGSATSYWNGDGFTTESGVHNIRFENTVARGNTDAGYDLKSSDTVLVNAVAEENNRSFRIWSTSVTLEDSLSLNPTYSGGNGGTAHVWLGSGASATLDNFQFSDGLIPHTIFDLSKGGATLTLIDTPLPAGCESLIWLLNGSIIEEIATPTNLAPTDIAMGGGIVAENAAAGTLVATLTATDPNMGDQLSYSLAGTHADYFEIIGNEVHVRTGAALDFETATQHDLTVTVADQGGLSYSKTVAIQVQDMVEGGNGTAGNDTLTGTAGADALRGFAGDDTYIVNNKGDVVTELANAGTDTVKSALSSYALTGNVENLAYTGSGNFSGAGNSLANTVTGGNGADTLHGWDGNDILIGGAGNDKLYGDKQCDTLDGGAGNDRLYGGANSDRLSGGTGDDYLTAEDGNDSVNGGAGRDVLIGGTGNDSFVFDQAPSAENADTIADFTVPGDTIRLDQAVFDQLATGKLASGAFAYWDDAGAADDRIVYNKANGNLYYDATGGDHGDAQLIATLANMPAELTADDVFVF